MKNIMLVEDDDDIRDVLETVLAGEGYKVNCYGSLHSASEALEKEREPDLILLDFMFPGENSGHFLDAMKSRGRAGQVPVLLMSAGNSELLGESASLASGFISKPIRIESLLEEIEKLVPATAN